MSKIDYPKFMRPTERLELLENIGVELQKRYTFEDINRFFAASGVSMIPVNSSPNSKRVYAKSVLSGVSDSRLLTIASELNVPTAFSMPTSTVLPEYWKESTDCRLFISHLSTHKDKAMRLKEVLKKHDISGFVAHMDIEPDAEWQVEVERALNTMDAMVAILTVGFSKSAWTQQEVGFALGRGTKIISLKMEEDPTGFLAKQQALLRGNRTADEIAPDIVKLLSKDLCTKARLEEAQDPVPF